MDDDLETMSREQLIDEVKKLRAGIRKHRDSTGHELCWHHRRVPGSGNRCGWDKGLLEPREGFHGEDGEENAESQRSAAPEVVAPRLNTKAVASA